LSIAYSNTLLQTTKSIKIWIKPQSWSEEVADVFMDGKAATMDGSTVTMGGS